MALEVERVPDGAIHAHFGLTYANYLVVPRSLLQSMPTSWQKAFVSLLRDLDEAFGHLDRVDYSVRGQGDNGRYVKDPIPHYNRGRERVEPREGSRAWVILTEAAQREAEADEQRQRLREAGYIEAEHGTPDTWSWSSDENGGQYFIGIRTRAIEHLEEREAAAPLNQEQQD